MGAVVAFTICTRVVETVTLPVGIVTLLPGTVALLVELTVLFPCKIGTVVGGMVFLTYPGFQQGLYTTSP